MRKLTFLWIALLACSALSAQETFDSRPKIGLVLGAGKNEVIKLKPLYGGGGLEGKGYFAAGINYIKPIKKWFSVEAGIEYSQHKVRASSAPMPGMWYWDTDASLISIPVNARFNFLKYFYAQSGLLADIDISDKKDIDRQTGIGAALGLGAKYDFKKVSVFINPYLRNHGIFAFNTPRGLFSNDMISETGVKLGVLYAIGK